MLIIGYRGSPDWKKVRESFKRCTSMSDSDIQKAVALIKKGQSLPIPNDFVLHDELKELGLFIR